MKKNFLIVVVVLSLGLITIVNAQQDTFSRVVFGYALEASSAICSFDNSQIIVGNGYHKVGIIIKVDSVGNIIWNRTYSNNSNFTPDVLFNSIIRTCDSCFVIVGSTHNPTSHNEDALMIKLDSNADTIWSRAVGFNQYDISAFSVQQTFDSGYIITGCATDNNSNPEGGVFVAKLNNVGHLEWSKLYTGGNSGNFAYSVSQTQDSGYVLIGRMTNYPPYSSKAFLMKLSSNGSFLWAKKFDTPISSYSKGHDLIIARDGFILALDINSHVVILKTDFSGNILWHKSYQQQTGGTYFYYSSQLIKTSDSCYVLLYGGESFNGIMKLDSLGDLVWSKSIFLQDRSIVESSNKELFIVGNGPYIGSKGFGQLGIIKTDSMGNSYNCVYANNTNQITETINNSSFTFNTIYGGVYDPIYPIIDSAVLLSYSGCIGYTGSINEIQKENKIQISPNPSNGIFNVDINIEKEGEIIIYNSLGENIYQSNFSSHQFEIDLSSKPNGVYLIKFICEDFVGVKKIIKQ
ncbi:MAG: T9SS type A sorting domain-containing protein [Saprospiraceae bacterium]|nr:T9SS type A sorting domain-containing protein [Saprospiraceae bacterium]